MSMVNLIIARGISTSCCRHGKRNFRKFTLINKRGSILFKKQQATNPHPLYPIDKRGVRDTGYMDNGKFIEVPEMIPELVVPDLKDFQLKAYVTYKSENVVQSKFTPEDLFNAVYSRKIENDFRNGRLDENGEPLAPSPEEKLTPKEARANASKTGTDMFTAPPTPPGTIYPQDKR